MGRTLPSLLEIADPEDIRQRLEASRHRGEDELSRRREVVEVLKSALAFVSAF